MKELAGRVLRHRGWLAAVLAIAIVSAVGIVVVLVARGSTPAKTVQRRPCDMPVADRAGVRGPVSPPEDGGLRVVEKGFAKLRGGWVALGVTVENTSEVVAYRTQVDFQVFDEQHRSAVDQTSTEPRTVVRVILPGQRIGVGSQVLVRRGPGFLPQSVAEVAGFDVKMTTAQWWPLDSTARRTLQPVTVQYQQTKRIPPDAANYFYSVDSLLCGTVVRDGTSIIFRDHSGAVAGGRFIQAGNYETCVPGKRNEDILVGGIVKGVDEQKTEIYPYCDLVDPRTTPASTSPRS